MKIYPPLLWLIEKRWETLENYYNDNIWPNLTKVSKEVNDLKRDYRKIINKLSSDNIWPEVDGNLRFSYGKVIRENKSRIYKTTMKDLIQVNNFDSSLQFAELADLTPYYDLTLCFLTDAQTSSGSSGSPVLNGKGELIGINFDRNQEGTMGDLYYNQSSFRNIVVDIPYILFLLQINGKSDWLLKELGTI